MSEISSDFTCICCRVIFKDSEIQRLHYKTDWHRYNLKRKVVDLPPITSEEFQKRVLNQKASDALQEQETGRNCKFCHKTFSNIKAYENHLNSKKHKENEANYVEKDAEPQRIISKDVKEMEVEEDSDIEEVDSDEWDEDVEDIDVKLCLFCGHRSRNLVKNITHMSSVHSFFIPDVEYCIDVHGLVEYLGQKIEQGFMCLWCNETGKTFHSAQSARTHMLDKGHCKMIHEGPALAEYTDFYDYSTSYPDADGDNVDKDQEIEIPELDGSEYQLVLPSGSTLGHRSLMRYFRQSIDPNREVRIARKSSSKLHKVLAGYRSLGWTPAQQETAARTARDVHYMKRMQSKCYMKLGLKANKFQPHFRQQVNY